MALPEEVARRLREHAKKKRGVLLKDVDLVTWNQAIDRVLEEGVSCPYKVGSALDNFSGFDKLPNQCVNVPLAFIKYGTSGHVQELRKRFPMAFADVVLAVPKTGKTRKVVLFEEAMLCTLLGFLVTAPKKYYRRVGYDLAWYNKHPGKFTA